jgi:cell shape-determining protein MreC
MMGRSLNFPMRGELLTLAVCVALSVTLLVLPSATRIIVADRLALVLTSPYWQALNFGQDVLRTRDENAWLQKRVTEMELLAATGERMQRDAGRLAGPAMDPGYDGDLVPCRVVMRQRARFATMIKVQSLMPVAWRPWQPVISGSGYLGRLRSVINDREAWVELLTAPEFALGVEIERTGLLGVLRPRGDRFVVEMVGRDEDVQPGDRVITSGIAEIREGTLDPSGEALTPRGFPVGVIVETSSPSDQLFKRIVVDPAASFNFNETVFVVTPLASGPTVGDGGVR